MHEGLVARLIDASIRNRVMVLVGLAMLVAGGVWALFTTPVDAIPDLSDVQVIVVSDHPGQAPQVVEDQVTYPVATALLSVPHASNVRGYSFFGLSMVYVIFEDGTDLYWARSRVAEALDAAANRLPAGVHPRLGPDATGVGWIYEYSLTSDRHDLAELRSLQDWYLRYELTALDGVSEVASVGGFVRQYQVEVDPEKMRAHGVSLAAVTRAIQRSNGDTGGRLLEIAETEFMVRSQGYLRSIDDLYLVPVGVDPVSHTPVLLRQIADVHLGPELRRGLVEMNGEGEVVTGIVVMRSGENALQVIQRVRERLDELAAGLPEGVEIHTSYDRSTLIHRAIDNLATKLLLEMLVVALVIALFLLHLRSSLVAALTIPTGVLASVLVMRVLGINANIMSLGGIAIAVGVMVDASVVMVENLHKHKERSPDLAHLELVRLSAKEVGPALFFSLLIITVSFLPVFTLQQQEGRLFAPLAWTKTFAMAASAVLAVTVVPVLMVYLVRGRIRPEGRHPITRVTVALYRPVLRVALRMPILTVLVAIAVTLATVWPAMRLGTEFMPPLNEGDLLYMPTTPPGISIDEARELLQRTDRVIASHPQVDHVLGKAGRADTATDPAPLSMLETTILLAPQDQWPAGKTIEDVIAELDQMVQFPGLTNAWTMPIRTRIDMLATGIKTPVGVKLMGDDLQLLADLAEQVEAVLRTHPDTQSVYADRVMGGHYVDIDVDRTEAARYGLTVEDVNDVVRSAIGGMNVTWTVEGLERYPVNVRYPRELRDDPEALKRIAVPTPLGHSVALGQVAEVSLSEGPAAIKSENARQTAWVYVDLRTTDIGGYVRAAREMVDEQIDFPDGVSVAWSGQYEYMQRANRRLLLMVPLSLCIIFLLLYAHFGSIVESGLVMASLPFALVGGVWLLVFSGYNLSVAVGVGFIALGGLAAETGVVMLVYLDEAYHRWRREGRLGTVADLRASIMEGAVERLRPKLMTVATTVLGLVPVLMGSEAGSRVMKRIAAPMVGGMVSSMVLTLVVLPALYLLWRRVEMALRPPESTPGS